MYCGIIHSISDERRDAPVLDTNSQPTRSFYVEDPKMSRNNHTTIVYSTSSTLATRKKTICQIQQKICPLVIILYIFLTEYSQKGQIFW